MASGTTILISSSSFAFQSNSKGRSKEAMKESECPHRPKEASIKELFVKRQGANLMSIKNAGSWATQMARKKRNASQKKGTSRMPGALQP
jgi:hypothetical protein